MKLPCFLFLTFFLGGTSFGKADELSSLKVAFLQGKIEQDRYLDRLVELRYECVSNEKQTDSSALDNEISAIDDEITKHPLAADSDSKALSRLRVGEWESPRHDYLYRFDHTWNMLPLDICTTHGFWKIEENKYYDWIPVLAPLKSASTIFLLDKKYFIFGDGKSSLYYEKRLK